MANVNWGAPIDSAADEAAKAEIDRLRGLLNARAMLVAEMRKGGYCLHAEYAKNSRPAMVPLHIALDLIAHARAALEQSTRDDARGEAA